MGTNAIPLRDRVEAVLDAGAVPKSAVWLVAETIVRLTPERQAELAETIRAVLNHAEAGDDA